MAMWALGPAELLMLLLLSSGGSMPDAVSIFPARDYFKMRDIDPNPTKLIELAGKDPTTAKTQIQQLMALRILAETPKLPPEIVKVVRDIAEGTRAKDKHGFAQHYARKVMAAIDGKIDQQPVKAKASDGLEWFPSDASIAGVIDFRLARIPGIPMASAEPLFWKFLPEKVKREVLTKSFEVLESTGNVELHRGAVAVAEGARGLEDPRIYARFSGKFNHEWIVETLRKQTPLTIEAGKGPDGMTFHYTEIERGELILALLGDNEFLLAGVPDRGAGKGMPLLQEMFDVRAKKKDSVLVGKRTKDLFAKVPAGALGMFVIDMPKENKGFFPPIFGPGALPEKAVLAITPAIKALDLQLEVVMANKNDADDLVKNISKMRERGIQELKMAEGKAAIPGFSTRPFIQLLESLQVEGKGSSTHVRLLVPEELIRNSVEMMMRLIPKDGFGPGDLPPPPPAEDKKCGELRPAA